MQIVKRDGRKEAVKLDKISTRIKKQTTGLDTKYVDAAEIAVKVVGGVFDGVTTVELDNLAAETSAMMVTKHPDYSTLAARIAISSLHKSTSDNFIDVIKRLYNETNFIDKKFYDTVIDNGDVLNLEIDYKRDFNYDYFGFKTLERSYLLKIGEEIVERPQHMIMRVAVGIHGNDIESAIKTYHDMSQGLYTHATPTLFNAGTKTAQLSSCFLVANKGDSKEGLMDTAKDVSIISAHAGGIGLHVHDVRASGSPISGSGGFSNGLLPMLKTYNELSKWWDQGGGKRKGSFAIYLEPWHKDVEILLDIRKNHGKEEQRARELFPALWIPDLFMKRVENAENWTLFCPNEVLKATGYVLSELYGEEFDKAYVECEEKGLGKTIPAQSLWSKILEAQIETGTPYMAYKDAVNRKTNQQNLGVIKSSNLCIEINEYSNAEETAVCNLASIALPKFVKGFNFDHKKLVETVGQITRNLDRVIDVNFYPTKETKNSNLKHRPIGIGVQGLADVFLLLGLPFESDEARELNKDISETIYYGFLKASNELAIERGKYSSFEGSPLSKGIFQFEMWDLKASNRYDWESLRKSIIEKGVRNSLGIAYMPTASTSQILGNNECFEPYTDNIYTRRTLSGEFIVVNRHLLKDLIRLGIWDDELKNAILNNRGSIQSIAGIPDHIKALYKTAWEISQKKVLDMSADRGAFTCQSQSMNVFMESPNYGKLTSMHFYGWKKGLKTGMYYLRSRPASDAVKFTVKKEEAPVAEVIACSLENPDACEMCGS